MPCDDAECTQIHVKNPSTNQCVLKDSPLGKMILNKTERIENSKENINDIKELSIKVDKILNILNILQIKLEKMEEKEQEKFQETSTELNSMEEISNAIRILKNDFGIVATDDLNHHNNSIIQNVLAKVKENLEKGKKTLITNEFVKTFL
jgi:hypothetical protein